MTGGGPPGGRTLLLRRRRRRRNDSSVYHRSCEPPLRPRFLEGRWRHAGQCRTSLPLAVRGSRSERVNSLGTLYGESHE